MTNFLTKRNVIQNYMHLIASGYKQVVCMRLTADMLLITMRLITRAYGIFKSGTKNFEFKNWSRD